MKSYIRLWPKLWSLVHVWNVRKQEGGSSACSTGTITIETRGPVRVSTFANDDEELERVQGNIKRKRENVFYNERLQEKNVVSLSKRMLSSYLIMRTLIIKTCLGTENRGLFILADGVITRFNTYKLKLVKFILEVKCYIFFSKGN